MWIVIFLRFHCVSMCASVSGFLILFCIAACVWMMCLVCARFSAKGRMMRFYHFYLFLVLFFFFFFNFIFWCLLLSNAILFVIFYLMIKERQTDLEEGENLSFILSTFDLPPTKWFYQCIFLSAPLFVVEQSECVAYLWLDSWMRVLLYKRIGFNRNVNDFRVLLFMNRISID